MIERSYIFQHAKRYAMESWRAGASDAARYAKWYADSYPEGDVSHTSAFPAWRDRFAPNTVCSLGVR